MRASFLPRTRTRFGERGLLWSCFMIYMTLQTQIHSRSGLKLFCLIVRTDLLLLLYGAPGRCPTNRALYCITSSMGQSTPLDSPSGTGESSEQMAAQESLISMEPASTPAPMPTASHFSWDLDTIRADEALVSGRKACPVFSVSEHYFRKS